MSEYRKSSTSFARPVDSGGAGFVGETKDLETNLLVSFSVAALSSDRRAMSSAVNDALANGIAPEVIADRYVPVLARQLGDSWCKDEMSFAGVTIGVSRLQSLLRELGPAWSGDTLASPQAPTILLVVCHEIYHTLGAMVLAGQLRRRGMSVSLQLGATSDEVATKMKQIGFEAIFISASIGESLESVRKIVDSVRTTLDVCPPIVVGGTILETEGDVRQATGADHTSNNSDEAIALCGLETLPLIRQEIGQ